MNNPLFHVVLYQPEIPHNTGAVGRTCAAINAKLWLVRPLGFQLTDKNLKRAGLDYWQYLNWEAVDDWNTLTERLPEKNRYFFFTKKAHRRHIDMTYERGDVFIFGSESRGLPPSFFTLAPENNVRIPIHSEVRSLNLSVSVGIAVYEAWRQLEVNAPNIFPR